VIDVLPGARLARYLLIAVAVVVILGLVLSALASPIVY
jgi:hypothetical protein